MNCHLWMVKKTTQILKGTQLYRISVIINEKNIGDSLEIAQLCSPQLGRTCSFVLYVLLNLILFFIFSVRTLNFKTFKYLNYLHYQH